MRIVAIVLILAMFVAPISGWGKGAYVMKASKRTEVLEFARAILNPQVKSSLEIEKVKNPFEAQKLRLKR